MSETSEHLVGRTVAGRYLVQRLLGTGGMGAVYEARQLSMDRAIALKLLHRQVASAPGAAERFKREMRASSLVEHPNTIRIYDYGEIDDGRLFLAMEFLAGRTLGRELDAQVALPLDRLVRIGVQTARALGAAHQHGIVHRDLKPDNVMLLDQYEHDFVKVLDFGIARFLDDERTQLTAEGSVIGTPAYMSPEQAMGQAVDHRSDLYSLGVMLYQMVTGRVPFDAPTMVALLVMHATERPTRPSLLAASVEPALEALIVELLDKDPELRPQSAAEVAVRLQACLEGSPVLAAEVGGATVEDAAPAAAAASSTTGAAGSASPGAAAIETVPRPRRPGRGRAIAALGAAALLVGGAVVVRSTGRSSAAASRIRLEALLGAVDPIAPESCRARDGKAIARLEQAAAALQAGGNPAGAAAAEQLLEDAPPASAASSAEYWMVLARARVAAGRPAESALLAAYKAAELCPAYAAAENLVGRIEQRAGRLDRARAAYDRALAVAPAYGTPRFNRGLLELQRGNPRAALGDLDELLRLEPSRDNAHLVRGQARLLTGDADGALADLGEATVRAPGDAEAWLLLGQARAKAGRASEAEDAYCKSKALGSERAAPFCHH